MSDSNLIPFKQKSMAAKPTRIVPFRQGKATQHTHTPVRRPPKVKFPSLAASRSRSRPHSPEDILPQCSALWELSARVPLVQALPPVRQASSPEPPPWSLAALSARGAAPKVDSGTGGQGSVHVASVVSVAFGRQAGGEAAVVQSFQQTVRKVQPPMHKWCLFPFRLEQ